MKPSLASSNWGTNFLGENLLWREFWRPIADVFDDLINFGSRLIINSSRGHSSLCKHGGD